MRTFIVAGSPEARPPLMYAPQPGDHVIAADSGALHARAWGWPVHLVIGDLDSLPEHVIVALKSEGVPLVQAAPEKDETDLELALAQALRPDRRDSAGEIIICGAFGGRVDHMLANVLLLARGDLACAGVMIVEGSQVLRVVRGTQGCRGEAVLEGRAGDLLTLLPIGGQVCGITTEGLKYPLRDEALALGQARGVSNVFTGSLARVAVRNGLLLTIHIMTRSD
jgi:thiamine pyrophosphokinase